MTSTTTSKNMVPSPSPSMPKLQWITMEWNVIQKKIGSSLLWLIVFSTIFLVFILHSSNPFTMTTTTTKEGLSQNPLLTANNESASTPTEQSLSQKPSSPTPSTDEVLLTQSPPLTVSNKSSVPITRSLPPKPSSPPLSTNEVLTQSPTLTAVSNKSSVPVTVQIPTPRPASSPPAATNEGLNQSPSPTSQNKTVTPSSPSSTTKKDTIHSPSLSTQNSSVTPSVQSSPKISSQQPSPIEGHNISQRSPLHSNNHSTAQVARSQPPKPSSLTRPLDDVIEDQCDMSKGRWVKDPRGPLYTNATCPTLPDTKHCAKYGKEQGYVYWRWQPDGCDLPRFEPKAFLNLVRGKKLAFIGDSLARNHMESLLCLLSQAETPKDIYKDSEDKFRTWYFPSHDFTLMVMWTEFYVQGIQVIVNGTGTSSYNVHLDKMNTDWTSKLHGLHYVVLSGANWFFRKNYMFEGGKLLGCVNCAEGNLTNLGIPFAIKRVLRKALEAIRACEECDGLVTLLRTYSPSHFEHGSWFTGGDCNRTRPFTEEEVRWDSRTLELRKIQLEELDRVRRQENVGNKKFGVLDVTKAIMLRADGHPGKHWNKVYARRANDCLHWCLPGPVDMWSDVLLATLKKNSVLYS